MYENYMKNKWYNCYNIYQKINKIIQKNNGNTLNILKHNKQIHEIIFMPNPKTQLYNKSLHQFNERNICQKIKEWIYNDINYEKHLLKTKEIFIKKALNGQKLNMLTSENAKDIIKQEILNIQELKTLNIIFKGFDELKKEYPKYIESATEEQIANTLFHYPLKKLLIKIKNEKIDGKYFINNNLNNKQDIIKELTGWHQDEIDQIVCFLFKNHVFTQIEFKSNIENILSQPYAQLLPNEVRNYIKNTLIKCNLEQIYYDIKHGRKNQNFSDKIINMVDELVENNNNTNLKDDLVKNIYDIIGKCFIFNKGFDWFCSNCGNHNYNDVDLSICILCGIERKESIILNIKNYDTFLMTNPQWMHTINNDKKNELNEIESTFDEKEEKIDENNKEKKDEIDNIIQSALKSEKFNLICPNRNDTQICPSILKLAKQMLQYKKWLDIIYKKTKDGSINIDETTQVDIEKTISNDTYKSIFFKCAKSTPKITENNMTLLQHTFDDTLNNIHDIMNKKTFLKTLRTKHKINGAIGKRLRKMILNSLKEKAQESQTPQFKAFLSDFDDTHWHHVLRCHINKGNKTSIKHTLRFYKTVVHFEDVKSQVEKCLSAKRKQQRRNKTTTNVKQVYGTNKNDIQNRNKSENKNIWNLNQYYIQSELDNIHCYLAHANWEYFVQRHTNQQITKQSDDIKYNKKLIPSDLTTINDTENQKKFITESNNIGKYGFGQAYTYPELSPKWNSIFEELSFNPMCVLSQTQITDSLIKAIRKHAYTISDDCKHEFICKYYNDKYKILRNDPIGIKHIYAIIVYTDITAFCTAYRSTYRLIDNETNPEEPKQRHLHLYYFARSLYEAVEFFGQYMDSESEVYHGLNKVMYFEQFSEYFNQPLSTTPALEKAQEFSGGTGIILVLKSAIKNTNNLSKVPKYLPVSWLSDFPQEQEKLFYGENVRFNIHDIIEADNMKKHQIELCMLNKFQQMIQNAHVEWNINDNNEIKMINALSDLITEQQNKQSEAIKLNNDEKKDENMNPYLDSDVTKLFDTFSSEENKQFESKFEVSNTKSLKYDGKYITKYGQEQFNYFCNSKKEWITIHNYTLLPSDLINALFGTNKNQQKISLIPLTKLFPNVTEIRLSELDINKMVSDRQNYVEIVKNYVESHITNKTLIKLEKISFKSTMQNKPKPNSTLQSLKSQHYKTINNKYKWNIKYEFENMGENKYIHNLIFENNNINIKQTSNLHISPSKQNQIYKYFMQIILVEMDYFQIRLVLHKVADRNTCFYIKEIDGKHPNEIIVIRKGQMSYERAVEMDNNQKSYHFALYNNKHANKSLSDSNTIRVNGIRDKTQIPPININYKPECIDLSTILKTINNENKEINIYWSTPFKSFGDIKYKIIKEERKEEEIISLLPYSISLSLIPLSFKVITINTINENIYESHPSQLITVTSIQITNDTQTDIDKNKNDT